MCFRRFFDTKPSTPPSKADEEAEEKTYDEWLAMGTTAYRPAIEPKKREPASQEDIEYHNRPVKMDPIRNMPYYCDGDPLPSKPFLSKLLSMIGFHSAPLSKPDYEDETTVVYRLGKSKNFSRE